MLTWDEEVKPSTPLPQALGTTISRSTETSPSAGFSGGPHRVNAADKHFINGKTDVNQLKLENPPLWISELKTGIKALFEKVVELEYKYAEDTMPHGVLGMNASMFKAYLRYIANRHATQIGLEPLFPNEENPFPWRSEMIALKKERNFFETRVIEHQSGGAFS